ncbi:MAG TPA: hypothetical protein VFZ34_33495, partial [Blastocatellia bacterium]|nr:hypothetical protein [Blastocatellia bacterium]
MKKTATTIALMTLVLIGTTLAQPPRRVAGSTAVGRGTGVGVKNRQPMNLHKRIDKATPLTQAEDGSGTDNANWQRGRRPNAVGNPFGLGGTVTAGAKNQQGYNLGDTATHEVGHKGKRRR